MSIALPQAAAGAKTWIGFLAMGVGMFMAILDIQIVASSLPEIQAGLSMPLDQLSWVQTAYLMAEIVAIPLTGWLTRVLSTRGAFVACDLRLYRREPRLRRLDRVLVADPGAGGPGLLRRRS